MRVTINTLVPLTLALLLAAAIYAIDVRAPPEAATASLYCLVVVYSWLLPWRLSPLYAALACSVLVLLAIPDTSGSESSGHFVGVNRVLSVVVIWVTTTLVAIARRSFMSLEEARDRLQVKVDERTRQLARKNLELETKNENLEQFVYIASHDLQEPLRSVVGFSKLLREEYHERLDEDGQRSLRFVEEAGRRMSRLVSDLLDYSRDGVDLQRTTVDLDALVQSTMRDLQRLIRDSGAVVSVGELPHVWGYETGLRALFQNLVANALKFHTPGEAPVIDISARDLGGEWRFEVADQGIGIAPEHRARVFRMFQRLHPRKAYEGTGIGLARCKKLVELHGGQIWVDPERSIGTAIRFTIPKE